MTPGPEPSPPRNRARVHADLLWLSRCPPLLYRPGTVHDANALLRETLQARPDWLSSITEQDIDALLDDRDRRLGRYVENLIALMVSRSPRLEVIARNLPIREQGRTLGELDMLVYDHQRRQLMHWELTIKFYLGALAGDWSGPDPADRLGSKARRLFQHQFPLTEKAATLSRLDRHGWRVDGQYLFSAGRLFYPWRGDLPAPPEAARGHLRGTWWPVDVARELDGVWWPLPKDAWLTGPARGEIGMSDNAEAPLAPTELADYVQSARRPVMVWHVRDRTRQPGFVIPADWPTP